MSKILNDVSCVLFFFFKLIMTFVSFWWVWKSVRALLRNVNIPPCFLLLCFAGVFCPAEIRRAGELVSTRK